MDFTLGCGETTPTSITINLLDGPEVIPVLTNLIRKNPDDTETILQGAITITSFPFKDIPLLPDTTYMYFLKDTQTEEIISNTIMCTTSECIVTDHSAQIYWDESTYDVRRIDVTFNATTITLESGMSIISSPYTHNNILPDTTYTYKLYEDQAGSTLLKTIECTIPPLNIICYPTASEITLCFYTISGYDYVICRDGMDLDTHMGNNGFHYFTDDSSLIDPLNDYTVKIINGIDLVDSFNITCDLLTTDRTVECTSVTDHSILVTLMSEDGIPPGARLKRSDDQYFSLEEDLTHLNENLLPEVSFTYQLVLELPSFSDLPLSDVSSMCKTTPLTPVCLPGVNEIVISFYGVNGNQYKLVRENTTELFNATVGRSRYYPITDPSPNNGKYTVIINNSKMYDVDACEPLTESITLECIREDGDCATETTKIRIGEGETLPINPVILIPFSLGKDFSALMLSFTSGEANIPIPYFDTIAYLSSLPVDPDSIMRDNQGFIEAEDFYSDDDIDLLRFPPLLGSIPCSYDLIPTCTRINGETSISFCGKIITLEESSAPVGYRVTKNGVLISDPEYLTGGNEEIIITTPDLMPNQNINYIVSPFLFAQFDTGILTIPLQPGRLICPPRTSQLNLRCDMETNTSITISFNTLVGVTYDILISSNGSSFVPIPGEQNIPGTNARIFRLISGLTPATTYKFMVNSSTGLSEMVICTTICILPGAHVQTPNGIKLIQDIVAGDMVIDEFGNPIKVINNVKFAADKKKVISFGRNSLGMGFPSGPLQITEEHPIKIPKQRSALYRRYGDQEVAVEKLVNGINIQSRFMKVPCTYTLITENRTFVMISGVPVGTWGQKEFKKYSLQRRRSNGYNLLYKLQ